MSTFWRVVALPVMSVALVTSCGDDGGSAGANSTAAPSTTVAAPSSSQPATTAVATTIEATTTTLPTDSSVAGDQLEIIVKIGEDSGPDRVEQVPLGSDVLLRVLSDTDDEVHVHGYDLEQPVKAGEEVAFEFTANQAGRFEVESHKTEDVLLVLQVG